MSATTAARTLPRPGPASGRLAQLRGTWPSVFGLVAFFVVWEVVIRDQGAESDFTEAIKPIEKKAGVIVGGGKGAHAAK